MAAKVSHGEFCTLPQWLLNVIGVTYGGAADPANIDFSNGIKKMTLSAQAWDNTTRDWYETLQRFLDWFGNIPLRFMSVIWNIASMRFSTIHHGLEHGSKELPSDPAQQQW